MLSVPQSIHKAKAIIYEWAACCAFFLLAGYCSDITWPLNHHAFINQISVVSHSPHWAGGQMCLHRMRLREFMVYCSIKAKVRLLWSYLRVPRENFKKKHLQTEWDIWHISPLPLSAFTPPPSICNVGKKSPRGVIGYNVRAFKKPAIKMTSDGSSEMRNSWWEVDACSCWYIIRTDTSSCSRWSLSERRVGSNSGLDVL